MKSEFVAATLTFLLGAMTVVAALAWNAAIQQIFTNIFGTQSSLLAMIGYAIVVTIIGVVIAIYAGRKM